MLLIALPLAAASQDSSSHHDLTILSSALFTWMNDTPAGYDFTPGMMSSLVSTHKNGDLLILKEVGHFQVWNPIDTVVSRYLFLGVSSGGTIIKNVDILGGIRPWKQLGSSNMGLGMAMKVIITSPITERFFITTVFDLVLNPVWGGSLGLGLTYRFYKKD